MLILASGSQGQAPGGAAPPPAGNAAAASQARPTIAVFNMAAVMRDYGKAQHEVFKLNKKRSELSADIVKWRGEYVKLQQEIPLQQVAAKKEEMTKSMFELAHRIEVRDREVNKELNDEATRIISQLYDDIKNVVDQTAVLNGYHIIFAYPDAIGPNEMNQPMIKELKLKPPAAYPFYIARHVDVTEVVTKTLNTWYPAPAVPKETLPGAPAAPGTSGVPSVNPGTGGAPPSGLPGRP
jgi:Skp family chaperone for outer membrane proteins